MCVSVIIFIQQQQQQQQHIYIYIYQSGLFRFFHFFFFCATNMYVWEICIHVLCLNSYQYLKEYNPPFYELNPDTHRPFANILRMRSAKIKNFGKYLKYWMPHVEHIRFEELLSGLHKCL
jgi:hypothetical protein